MKNINKHKIPGGLILIISLMAANFLNFLFNAILGRALTFAQFGQFTLFSTMWAIIGIFLGALSGTVNHRVSYLFSQSQNRAIKFFSSTMVKGSVFGVLLTLIFVLFSSPIAKFFNITDANEIILFAPGILTGLLLYSSRGFLQGTLKFKTAAIFVLLEPIIKLIAGILFITLKLPNLIYLSIPISVIITLLIIIVVLLSSLKNNNLKKDQSNEIFPTTFLIASLLAGLSTYTFSVSDVLLARHFLSAMASGEYALLSLIGKMIYFVGSILNGFIVTYISRDDGLKKITKNKFNLFFLGSALLTVGSFIILGPLGYIFVPILLGAKAQLILPYLTTYAIATSFFTLSNTIIIYHLVKKRYFFAVAALLMSLFMVIGIFFSHANIEAIANVFLITSFASFIAISILHFFYNKEETNETITDDTLQTVSPKIHTVTIGIPAFNEENNIRSIIEKILIQKEKGFVIKKIIVASDGSTDKTAEIVRSIKNPKIFLIDGKENNGINSRHNEIIAMTNTDILVLMNADILLGNDEVVSDLIDPILKNKGHLTAQWAKPLPGRTFLERILCSGFNLKYGIYTKLNNGDNIYTCIGHLRALSKEFYPIVNFPLQSEGEDQYLYLLCIAKGFTYKHAYKADAYFRLPSNWKDYKHYARRIFQTQRRHKGIFDEELNQKSRRIPKQILVEGFISEIIHDPIKTPIYILLHFVMQRWALKQADSKKMSYEISLSTKKMLERT